MFESYPNQKIIVIHREKPDKDFLQIKNTHWMEFNKRYGPYALQLYLYLAKNADGYSLALSPAAAEMEAGIKKTSFYEYIKKLKKEGYLVQRNGNTYDFYETPHKQEEKENVRSSCGEFLSSQEELNNLPHEHRSSPELIKTPQSNKEIDNRQKDNLNIIIKDKSAIEKEWYPVREVHIRPPERKGRGF